MYGAAQICEPVRVCCSDAFPRRTLHGMQLYGATAMRVPGHQHRGPGTTLDDAEPLTA